MRASSISSLLLAAGALARAQSTAPVIAAGGTVNAADYSRAAAPGGLVALFGLNLSAAVQAAGTLPLPTTLAGVSVEVTDGARVSDAPLYFVSPEQINIQLPFDIAGPSVQLRVRNPAGSSNTDALNVSAAAPRFFTVAISGEGRAILTHSNYVLASRDAPAKPGEEMIIYLNSLGAVAPPVAAGLPPGDGGAGGPLSMVVNPVTALVNGKTARVDYAGLAPQLPGVYQVNILMPYDNVAGDVEISIQAGAGQTQDGITIPVEPNGFYWVITGGRFPAGQSLNGMSGPQSALAFRSNDQTTWGTRGFGAWTKDTGAGTQFAAVSGVALTLRDANGVVFDNNGIEDGSQVSYYNNLGAASDNDKPGLSVLYSASNYLDAVWAGYFKLAQSATITQIAGYFAGTGEKELPFDPANVYNRYRMNIWSNNSNNMPAETNNFTGDVFSTDNSPGTFSYSDTGVRRIFSDGATSPIYRLVYTLNSPMTLTAGEYWFSHDLAVSDQPAQSTRAFRRGRAVRPSGSVIRHP